MENAKKGSLGVMVDCCRAAIPSVAALKKFILDLEKMGYNSMQLYTEDTYEITEQPLFGHMRGRYSKEELKEIDAFAAAHGIEVVPCIQVLAHLQTLFFWDEMYAVKDNTSILLIDEEKTYQLIDDMFKTVYECFKCRTVNIGMDEAWTLGAGQYYAKHGDYIRSEIFLRHLNRVSEMAKKYGFTLLMWSDMFFRSSGYPEYYDKHPVIPEEVKAKVPDNVELAYWDYYSEDKEIYDGMIDAHLSFNKKTWFAGGAWRWIGFQSSNEKTFRTTLPAIKSCVEKKVDEVFITLWGDDGSDCPLYSILPGLVYAAECYRGNYDLDNAKKVFEELFGERWDDFMLFDLKPDDDIPVCRECGTGAKELLYSDPFLGKFDACVLGNGKESKMYARKAVEMSEAKTRTERFKYMFDKGEKLCRLLSVKYDLGYRTREAYQSGDKKELKKICKDFDLCIKYLDKFIDSFRKEWYVDNKPHGFDIHDIRLGGLKQRLTSCGARLKDYVAGKLDRIEELEIKLVPMVTGENKKGVPQFNCYVQTATLNVL